VVSAEGDAYTVDVGSARVLEETKVSVADHAWPAVHVVVGNQHAVVFVDSLDDAGPLVEAPTYDASVFPDGANVEFVVRRGDSHVAMRVHERGSGETRSCGTGACAVMVASAVADGRGPGSAYDVDVPGGRLRVTWTADGRVLLTGPAVIVARGTTDL
jgi:diaminopimelate epimerase